MVMFATTSVRHRGAQRHCAARLAEFGFKGPPGALDGAYGYFHAYGPGYDPACLESLGTRQGLAETGFKPHAGCRHVHSCVDATMALRNSNGSLDLDAITSIEVDSYLNAITPYFRIDPEPQNAYQACYSLPVTVAVVLQRGSLYKADIQAWTSRRYAVCGAWSRSAWKRNCKTPARTAARCASPCATAGSTAVGWNTPRRTGEHDERCGVRGQVPQAGGRVVARGAYRRLIDSCNHLEELDDVGQLLRLSAVGVRV